jgi:hypothetical protein
MLLCYYLCVGTWRGCVPVCLCACVPVCLCACVAVWLCACVSVCLCDVTSYPPGHTPHWGTVGAAWYTQYPKHTLGALHAAAGPLATPWS